jgi:outer membrane protein TolC
MRFFKSKQMDEKKRSAYAKEEMLFNHMHARYQHGLANHVQLIDSKLSLLKEQKEHINAQIDSEIKLVALYKALGGSF